MDQMPNNRPPQMRRSSTSRSGFLILFVLIIVLTGFSTWQFLVFQQYKKESQQIRESLEVNLNTIIEELKLTGESFQEINQERKVKDDTLNDEIRKLWNVANNKNKKNIAFLNSKIKELKNENVVQSDEFSKKIKTLQTSITELTENIKTVEGGLNASVELVNGINDQLQETVGLVAANTDKLSKIGDYEKLIANVASQGKKISALDTQRKSTTNRILEVRQEIALLKARLNAIENAVPVPGIDVTKSQ